MQTTTAFRALQARRIDRLNRGGFVVRAINKDGSYSKVLSKEVNGQTEFTAEEATAFQQRLQLLNPGHFWAVLPV